LYDNSVNYHQNFTGNEWKAPTKQKKITNETVKGDNLLFNKRPLMAFVISLTWRDAIKVFIKEIK